MTRTPGELARRLRESDPLLRERDLAAAETAQMRRMVIDAADRHPAHAIRPGTFALAGAFVFAVVFGVTTAWKAGNRSVADAADRPSGRAAHVTQIHFSTPGGTRIIWTLDPAFHLHEAQ